MIPGSSPSVRAERVGSSRNGYSAIVDNVPPFTDDIHAEKKALAALVAEHVGSDLERFHSWTVTRYSLDSTATVTLHTN